MEEGAGDWKGAQAPPPVYTVKLCLHLLYVLSNVLCLVAQLCLALWVPMDCSPPGSFVHRDSPGQNTGVGCHALFQRIFPPQGSNPGLPHCRRILYHLSHQGSPGREWKWKLLSHVWLFATPWTIVHQGLLSMLFSRQEYWSGVAYPFSSRSFQHRNQTSLLHCRRVLYHLSHQGSPGVKYWVIHKIYLKRDSTDKGGGRGEVLP